MLADALPSFVQSLNPAHSTLGSTLIALIPIVLLLVLLPVLRMSAWQAVIIGSVVTIILAHHRVERPGRRDVRGVGRRRGHRHLVDRLDHLLGGDHLQHAGEDRGVRRLPPLDRRPGDGRHPGAGDPARLGARRAARGPGGVRLPVGGDRPDPGRPRRRGTRRHPGRRDRQQRAGVVRRARRAHHRPGHRDEGADRRALGVDRPDRRDPRAAAAVDLDLPGGRAARAARRVAAGRGRVAVVHTRPVPHVAVARPLPARHHRRDHLLRLHPAAAAVLAAARDARLRRRADRPGRARGGSRTS